MIWGESYVDQVPHVIFIGIGIKYILAIEDNNGRE
jgi:hypothetical protein